jgi:hypothetical protein
MRRNAKEQLGLGFAPYDKARVARARSERVIGVDDGIRFRRTLRSRDGQWMSSGEADLSARPAKIGPGRPAE